MFTRFQINDITHSLYKKLTDITVVGDKLNAPKSNVETIALELFTAQTLRRMADGRYKNALALALDAGIIDDYAQKPMRGGTNEDVYTGEHIRVHVEARRARHLVDVDKFERRLRVELPDKQHVIEDCRVQSTSASRPAHVITVELIGLAEQEVSDK